MSVSAPDSPADPKSAAAAAPAAAPAVAPPRATAHAYRLEPFGPGSADRSADLAHLHELLLGHSPVALLGPDFMARFYYRVLPRLGLICGYVAYIDDRPAGFIVATHDSSGFMQAALKRKFLRVAWIMAWSALREPARLGAIWEAVQIMRGLPPPQPGQPNGELLSFGVLPEFRARDFMIRTRLRISQDLLKGALEQLRQRGAGRVRVIVDADNLEARLFYLGNGWRPGMEVVPGWRKKTVEFLWGG
jgi:ribosomal protein S18 acetylase RimI-like enzyme